MDLGAEIRAERSRKRMTQKELARACGLPQAVLIAWEKKPGEKGSAEPSEADFQMVMAVLGAEPARAAAVA